MWARAEVEGGSGSGSEAPTRRALLSTEKRAGRPARRCHSPAATTAAAAGRLGRVGFRGSVRGSVRFRVRVRLRARVRPRARVKVRFRVRAKVRTRARVRVRVRASSNNYSCWGA